MRAPNPDCAEMELLLQADLDGELDAASAATVANHIAHCEHCAAQQACLSKLRALLQSDLLREKPSEQFTNALRGKLLSRASESLSVVAPSKGISAAKKNIGLLGAGAALAASLLLMLRPAELTDSTANTLVDSVVAEHVRSLQADHLLDVVSSDRHTVKPWFNGKLDFVPPVIDFADAGFILIGGRLDYLAGRNVAALVYRHGAHPINLFIWPGYRSTNTTATCKQQSGYQVCSWQKDAMIFWGISDVSSDEMQKFVALWQS